MKLFSVAVLVALLLACGSRSPGEPAAAQNPNSATVTPILKTYCVSCHGGDKPKADLAIDTLAPDFAKNGEAWKTVWQRLTDGSMPPKGKPRPTDAEAKTVKDWVSSGLNASQAQKTATEGRARLRRLNRIEYANTMRDLLGAEVDIDTLPEDGIASGFDNVDAALDLSSTLLERYLEVADSALDALFVKGSRPKTNKQHIDLIPLAKQMTKTNRPQPRFGTTSAILEDAVAFFTNDQPPKIINEGRVSTAGRYRYRISAYAYHTNGKPLTFLIFSGFHRSQGARVFLTDAFDVPADKPTVVEFTERLEAGETIRIAPHGLPVLYQNTMSKDYGGPGLAVQWVEVEGPLLDAWPPAELTKLLGGVDRAKGTAADAEAIVRRFAARAFRRPVTDAELAPYFALVKSRLDKGQTFEASLRLGLKAILCSPDFLYLSAKPGKLSDFDLATRLSYFLWSTTPDDALAELAAKGDLGKSDVLRQQVERMLKDPKARAFTENFTGQWLSLRNLKMTVPERHIYPEFDPFLELSLPRETHLFFEEILKGDRNLLEFVHSDWSMLNERLAQLYGIPDVNGSAFRKVQLPANSHRGGVLTQAAVLKVTANGTNTSPVTRGAWVLDHILGTPAPPPPKDVPAIEPDIRGATTIREQLTKHRQIESCASCHAKIDPVGNALESFDVIGGWRENYRNDARTSKSRIQVKVGAKTVPVGIGKKVDATDELPGGKKFTDVDAFKKLVLENPDQIARSLTEKLLVYGTGHGLEFADRETVEKIVTDVKAKNYGFRTLIHDIVQSPTFRSK